MSLGSPTGFILKNTEVECKDNHIYIGCGWKGLVKDTIKESYCSNETSWLSLAGREGILYLCPNCKNVLINETLKMS